MQKPISVSHMLHKLKHNKDLLVLMAHIRLQQILEKWTLLIQLLADTILMEVQSWWVENQSTIQITKAPKVLIVHRLKSQERKTTTKLKKLPCHMETISATKRRPLAWDTIDQASQLYHTINKTSRQTYKETQTSIDRMTDSP